MGWQRLVAGRAVVGGIIDIIAVTTGVQNWPLGYATALMTASGFIGYWYAWRIEQRHRATATWWRIWLVWAGTAPETPIVVLLWLWLLVVLVGTLVMNPSPPWRELLGTAVWWPVLSSTVVAQGVVTCSWARWRYVWRYRAS